MLCTAACMQTWHEMRAVLLPFVDEYFDAKCKAHAIPTCTDTGWCEAAWIGKMPVVTRSRGRPRESKNKQPRKGKVTASDSARAPEPPEDLVAALPIELWQRIASCMSLRSWTSAASTCKALWNLQLVDLDLEGGSAGESYNVLNKPFNARHRCQEHQRPCTVHNDSTRFCV